MLSEYKRPRKQYLMGGQQQLHSQRRHRQCVRRGGVRVAKYKLKFNPLTDLSREKLRREVEAARRAREWRDLVAKLDNMNIFVGNLPTLVSLLSLAMMSSL